MEVVFGLGVTTSEEPFLDQYLSVVDHICVNSSMFDWAHGEAIGNHWITLVLLLGELFRRYSDLDEHPILKSHSAAESYTLPADQPRSGLGGTLQPPYHWEFMAMVQMRSNISKSWRSSPILWSSCSTLDSRIASSYHGSPLGCQQNLWDQPKPPFTY